MRRPNDLFLMTASAVLTALAMVPLAALGQTVQATSAAAAAPSQTPLARVPMQPPPTPEAIGDSMMAHRRYQAAIEAYKQVKPATASALNKMGIAYQLMFNNDDAERCYEASLRLDPKNANVWNNMGTIFDSQKDYRSAVRMYKKALKIDPKSPLVMKNMGTDLLAQHKYEKGWEYYKAALTLDPQIFDRDGGGPRVENPASLEQRGAMNYYMAKGCVRAGENERAIDYLRLALTEGFTSRKKLAEDSEFAGLHGMPEFDRLLAEQEKQ